MIHHAARLPAPRLALALTAAMLIPSGAEAQFGPQRSPWALLPDSVFVDLSIQPTWRRFPLAGDLTVAAGFDAALYGHAVLADGDWGLTGGLHGFHVLDAPEAAAPESGPRKGRVAADVVGYRRIGDDGARLALTASPYVLPWDESAGAELGLGLRALPLPWLPEEPARLDLEAIHDFGTFDGTLVHAALRQMPGLGAFAVPIAVEAWADDWSAGGFQYRAWQASIGFAWDPGTARGGAGTGRDADTGVFRFRLRGFVLDPRAGDAAWGLDFHAARTF